MDSRIPLGPPQSHCILQPLHTGILQAVDNVVYQAPHRDYTSSVSCGLLGLLWLELWVREFPDVSAGTIWRMLTLVFSDTFEEDMTMSVGMYCKTNCNEER